MLVARLPHRLVPPGRSVHYRSLAAAGLVEQLEFLAASGLKVSHANCVCRCKLNETKNGEVNCSSGTSASTNARGLSGSGVKKRETTTVMLSLPPSQRQNAIAAGSLADPSSDKFLPVKKRLSCLLFKFLCWCSRRPIRCDRMLVDAKLYGCHSRLIGAGEGQSALFLASRGLNVLAEVALLPLLPHAVLHTCLGGFRL